MIRHADPSPPPRPHRTLLGRFNSMGRALRHRNYRLFFLGQGLSLIGTWMQGVAIGWLVYRLTGSQMLLGVVGFAGSIPTFLLAPLAGVLADRMPRRRLLLVTQTLAMVQAFVLAGLTLGGVIQTWSIVVLSALLGIVNAFDFPIRHSFVVEMIEDREDLSNAIAMNSFLVNGARLVGPSIAGVIIAAVGEGVCFLINAATFLAVIAALWAMRIRPAPVPATHPHPLHHLREGWSYAMGFAPIRTILALLATVSLLGVSSQVLMPVFARDVLHGGPRMLGLLTAAVAVGAMGGGMYLAQRGSVRGLGRILAGASALFGAGLIGFGLSGYFALSVALLVVAGFGMMIQFAASNSLIQTLVDDDKRSRVMSLYVMAFMGMGPFGSLLAGWMARTWGAPATVIACGCCCVIAGSLFAMQLPRLGKLVHPIYIRLGIVPDGSPIPWRL